ncbi:MAG: hypothetical protein AAGD07_16100 [Planctomycetota bacterium]
MAKKRTRSTRRTSERDRIGSALAAAVKQHAGDRLTQTESRDLKWYEKRQRTAWMEGSLRAVPKGQFCKMAGRQQKVIDEQAERLDLPIDGATVDLFEAIKAYHDLIVANSRRIVAADDADAITEGSVSQMDYSQLQLIKLREEVTKLQRSNESLGLRVTKERGDTIDRQELRGLMDWLSTRLQAFGQQLRRTEGGEEAQRTLNEFLQHLADECEHGALVI